MASVLDCYRFRECSDRGREGENFTAYELEEILVGTGLTVRVMTNEDPTAPFDIEIWDGDKPRVGIENKDLAPWNIGTWNHKAAIKRKKDYAAEHGIRKTLTTVSIRERNMIGFRVGIANSHVSTFNFDRGQLRTEIIAARAEA